jgi:carbamoyl-phosphate synthase small subunit
MLIIFAKLCRKMTENNTKAILMLQDGMVFYGKSAGYIGTTTGEICFNTGMTGYQEVFTDPSYYGQILVMTSDHIGNYGAAEKEVESDSLKIAGLVCKNFSGSIYSRKLAACSLQQYLEDQKCVAICEVDTRAIVRHIRHKGVMNAIISSEIFDEKELKKILDATPSMEGLELSTKVSATEPYYYGDKNAPYKVSVLDCGIKQNILKCMAERGIYAKVFPARTPAKELIDFQPHGFFISNGPGDPAAMPYAVNTVKELLKTGKPFFGICLGHQILALANGISTYKMFNGHRGLNHPVKNLITGKAEITSQNHGFAVNADDIRKNENVEVTHINLNDNTIEGIRIRNKKAFSVQYHPESSPGPHDSRYLFDEFIQMMTEP